MFGEFSKVLTLCKYQHNIQFALLIDYPKINKIIDQKMITKNVYQLLLYYY